MTPRLLMFAVVCGTVLLQLPSGGDAAVLGVLHSLIRNNLAGTPVNFETQRWPFDPEVAAHWRVEYERQNGIRAEGLIERLGLGEDTHTAARKAQQQARDSGVVVSQQPVHNRP